MASAVPTLAGAQLWRCPSVSAGSSARVAAMATRADIFALDRSLSAAGLPTVAHGVEMLAAEVEARRGRVVLLGAAGDVIGRHASNANGDVSTGGTIASLGLGIAVACGAHWAVYPMAGVGTTRLDLSIAGRSGATVDSALVGKGDGSALDARTWYDDFGLGVSLAPGRAAERDGGRFVIGARGGYVERFRGVRWRSAGRPLDGGPNFGLSGPYAVLSVGVRL